ncbi:hypothetical protein HOR18_gp023 [Staphylococcus phage vB_SscM-1]|uniref:Uncharacterized protein n=2 Tax=Sciuriunavirus SscM1 TaxID=2734053 RepID=A0A1X9I9J8_9CAUD|nr:hypothetical protein HOR18_gp023 [Staphylococcus phage vB_SscM-1]ANT44686.1 hypothetical protein vB_SscM-1_023 [Staphylococcus phage vB_SscM-1]ANT44889.1 hypothetical protein vB_SscM-2_022 [Staphylococcus phage vB_SscM-2]
MKDTIKMYQERIKYFTKEIHRMLDLIDNAEIHELNDILASVDDLRFLRADAERMLEFYEAR